MIVFARHPETFSNKFQSLPGALKQEFNHWNKIDSEISPEGENQALDSSKFLADWLAKNNKSIKEMVLSPATRVLQYANIMRATLGYEGDVFIEPLIRECVRAGGEENIGLTKAQLADKKFFSEYHFGDQLNLSRASEAWNAGVEVESETNSRLAQARANYFSKKDDDVTLIMSHWLLGNLLLEIPDRIPNCGLILLDNPHSQSSRTIERLNY